MKTSPATLRPSRRGSGARESRVIESSRAAREKAEPELTPAERLTLALSDLCADVHKGWVLIEHARHPGDPVLELLRMTCGGVGIDILISHRNWEVAMVKEALIVPWQGVGIPSVRVEAPAAMKLRAGGP